MKYKIEILGAECKKCSTLLERVQKVVHENNLDASVEKITDTTSIASYGIFSIPALVINEKIFSKGYVPSENEIKEFINTFLPENDKLIISGMPVFKGFRLIMVLLVIGAFITIFIVYYNQKSGLQKERTDKELNLSKPISIADSVNMLYNYSLNRASYKITFLEFGSTGCRECKKMEAVMEEVKQKFKSLVNVVFYNVRKNENRKIVEHFGIQLIPVQVLMDKNGKEYFRHMGYCSLNELSTEFKKQGVYE